MSDFLKKYEKDIRVQVNNKWLIFGKKEFTEKRNVKDLLEYYIPRFQKNGVVTSSIEKVKADTEYLPVKLGDVRELAQNEMNSDHFRKFYDYNDVPIGEILIFRYSTKNINLIIDGVHRLSNRIVNQSLNEEVVCHYLQSRFLPKASIDVKMILDRI